VLESLTVSRAARSCRCEFGYWRVRLGLLATAACPTARSWPQLVRHAQIHLCTIRDFLGLAADLGLVVEQAQMLDREGQPWRLRADSVPPIGWRSRGFPAPAV